MSPKLTDELKRSMLNGDADGEFGLRAEKDLLATLPFTGVRFELQSEDPSSRSRFVLLGKDGREFAAMVVPSFVGPGHSVTVIFGEGLEFRWPLRSTEV